MKIQIEEKILLSIKKTYHFVISLDDKKYIFIVKTIVFNGSEMLDSISRGDFAKLKTSEKKLIKRTIERMF